MTTQEIIFNTPLYQKVKGAEAEVIVRELQHDGRFAFNRIQFDGYNMFIEWTLHTMYQKL